MPAIENVSKQVSHWIHDEQACVTVQRIVQTFQLSWDEASSVLKGVPADGKNYSVIHFASTSNNDSTNDAFRLKKSPWDDSTKSDESSEWYALALEGSTESIHTAHEKDLCQFQTEIEQFPVPSSLRPWDQPESEESSEGFASSIAISEPVTQRLASLGKRKADAFENEPKDAPSKAVRAPQKKTTTSAKNFFANKGSTTSSSKSSKKTGGNNSNNTNNSKAKGKPVNNKVPTAFQPKKKDEKKNDEGRKPKVADEEKENVQNKSSRVGNADDVVFDEEESSDEEPEKEVPAARSKKAAPSRVQPSIDVDMEEEDEEEEEKPVAKKPKFPVNPGQKRRRKKLVEKTSTDENGYLYTETVTVWEDIPSDEEPEPAPKKTQPVQSNKSKKSAAAKPKGMKQASLMGFFAKKK